MPPPPLPSSTTASAAQQQQQQRPAFNTNQQHYSPLKSHAPKPLTATFLAPPSPSKLPANVAISAETSRLQTELLQLSLMHRDAAAVSAEWSASARSKLGARFEDVARESRQLTQLEQREAEGHNIAALLRWCDADADADADGERLGGQAMALEDKIQTLDQVLGGIWSLSGGEQYARLTREFEDWAEQVADILAAQRKGAAEDLLDDSDEVLFVSELDTSGWKSDCPGLVRKLQSWRRMLRDLGRVPLLSAAASPADASLGTREENGRPAAATAARPQRGAGEPSKQHSRTQSQHHARQQSQSQQQQPEQRQQQTLSSLERILADCETLVNDMLAELTLMEAIERDALQAENDWILRVNRDLRGSGSGSHYHGDEGAVGSAYDVIATPSATGRDAVPLWKMVL
ncbi:uncharacterized protein B0I36DRAFT_359495 [Microdochium trichocladiopsis]|uniref:Uncharacterized protein n=1 Tax=Microdochium trichocladiopsis TaxID=1682393 RepID=A0A9P9BUP7_9PEZI|nr:uncharacterized protein B0I36DRAFT_359495 [Microdochium trichocladiopsis]KAH7037856.1 hypothetical protein B0I36DRAFT_359495 [Microdochium trichocladiopsis]